MDMQSINPNQLGHGLRSDDGNGDGRDGSALLHRRGNSNVADTNGNDNVFTANPIFGPSAFSYRVPTSPGGGWGSSMSSMTASGTNMGPTSHNLFMLQHTIHDEHPNPNTASFSEYRHNSMNHDGLGEKHQISFNSQGGKNSITNSSQPVSTTSNSYANSQAKIFVGGISWSTNEESLQSYFEQFGPVDSVEIMRDRVTGNPRGFAFVIFQSDETVDRILASAAASPGSTAKHVIDCKLVDVKRAHARGSSFNFANFPDGAMNAMLVTESESGASYLLASTLPSLTTARTGPRNGAGWEHIAAGVQNSSLSNGETQYFPGSDGHDKNEPKPYDQQQHDLRNQLTLQQQPPVYHAQSSSSHSGSSPDPDQGAADATLQQQIQPNKIFIGGLHPAVDREELKAHFARYGRVCDACVMFDPITKRSRGFGFITYEEGSDAAHRAMADQVHSFRDKAVELKYAQPKFVPPVEPAAVPASSGSQVASATQTAIRSAVPHPSTDISLLDPHVSSPSVVPLDSRAARSGSDNQDDMPSASNIRSSTNSASVIQTDAGPLSSPPQRLSSLEVALYQRVSLLEDELANAQATVSQRGETNRRLQNAVDHLQRKIDETRQSERALISMLWDAQASQKLQLQKQQPQEQVSALESGNPDQGREAGRNHQHSNSIHKLKSVLNGLNERLGNHDADVNDRLLVSALLQNSQQPDRALVDVIVELDRRLAQIEKITTSSSGNSTGGGGPIGGH